MKKESVKVSANVFLSEESHKRYRDSKGKVPPDKIIKENVEISLWEPSDWEKHSEKILQDANVQRKAKELSHKRVKLARDAGDYRYQNKGLSMEERAVRDLMKLLGCSEDEAKAKLRSLGANI